MKYDGRNQAEFPKSIQIKRENQGPERILALTLTITSHLRFSCVKEQFPIEQAMGVINHSNMENCAEQTPSLVCRLSAFNGFTG